MDKKIKDFHHYKGENLTRFEKVERRVIELISQSKIPDSQREDSITFEFMHAAGCMQIGRLLAEKRGLDVDTAGVAAMIHDIYTIESGTYKNHGPMGAPITQKILEEIGGFSPEEIKIITDAVFHHSEKEIYSDDPYIELVKDADVLDCSLYKGAEGFYRIHKPEHIFNEYVNRMKKIRDGLGLKVDEVFR